MEKSQFEKSFCHSSHRHLRSETYRTLIQVLSACYEHSQDSAPQQPRPGPDICERGELVSPDSLVPDNSRPEKEVVVDESFEATIVEDGGFRDQQMVITEIEDMMQTKEDGNLLKQKGLMVGDDVEATACQDMGFDLQQMLTDELEQIVKGNNELVEENNNSFSATSTAENQSGVIAWMNNQEEHLDVQQIAVGESGKVWLDGDKGPCNMKVSESFDLSLGKSMDCQVSKPSEDVKDRSPSRTNEFELQHDMQQKEMEPEKVGHTNGIVGSDNYISENVEVEEGEISGDFDVNDVSLDIFLDDSVVSEEKKVDEKQVNGSLHESTSFIMNTVNHANSDRAVELEESVRNERQFKSKSVVHGASTIAIDSDMYNCVAVAGRNKRKANVDEEGAGYPATCPSNPLMNGEILEQNATGMPGIASKEKLDSGVGNKKRRGTPSKEKKAKKKQKERKKRAEKNRQLGVKRLKLRPVVKPKAVAYCRHYLMGRCHEGDKCKYSHDTVPLTKSKPCCHFTRNSCMKGDDCPFDHQLSKYPCNNFVTNGFCNRGDNCMFSHKIPPKEDALSAPSGGKNEAEAPSLLNVPNSQKQPSSDRIPHHNVDVSNSRKASSFKNTEQNVAETVLKPPALAPKGISCLFLGKSSALESSKIKQGNLSPKRNANGKIGNQPELSASSTFQNMNETPKRTPSAVTAKGVNFLSFGNAPLEYSSGKKLSSLLLNSEDGLKSSLVNNVSGHKQASSFCDGENSTKDGNQTTQSVSSTIQMSNEMLKKITPLGMNFPSNKKALTYASTRDEENCLPSSSGNGISRSLQESQSTPDKHQNSRGIPCRLLGSPLVSGQTRSTANSAQKAVESTLAIASKINVPAVSNEFNNETWGKSSSSNIGTSGGALNDSAKASKILEFLSGFGIK
ncbi:hypothetical protein ACOSQ2_015379 [Xanthoceras sorbifolium]|uniref:C3H1-type domain-containing protein n=1 Tax=Xanthoceras sorbifolium TaxID=99658 RepID=A0ABQ8I673_9ROSI|nr:hypothetical protein JRO89_XS04G0204700 [Xanthoceras sorbifolium]